MNHRIYAVRSSERVKLSQADFGERIGVTAATISRFESGQRHPSNQTILSICREFDINEAWLRTGEGEMYSPHSRRDELASLVSDLLAEEPGFKHHFITVLLRMTPEEWLVLERIVQKLAKT